MTRPKQLDALMSLASHWGNMDYGLAEDGPITSFKLWLNSQLLPYLREVAQAWELPEHGYAEEMYRRYRRVLSIIDENRGLALPERPSNDFDDLVDFIDRVVASIPQQLAEARAKARREVLLDLAKKDGDAESQLVQSLRDELAAAVGRVNGLRAALNRIEGVVRESRTW